MINTHLNNYGADTTDLEGVESVAKSISCSSARTHLRDVFTLAERFQGADYDQSKRLRKALVRISTLELLSNSARLIQAGVSLEDIQEAIADLEPGIHLV